MSTEADRIRQSVTLKDVKLATWICFFAWTFKVYDFILFANLLPVMGDELGWTGAQKPRHHPGRLVDRREGPTARTMWSPTHGSPSRNTSRP